jgi:hypothetical protein
MTDIAGMRHRRGVALPLFRNQVLHHAGSRHPALAGCGPAFRPAVPFSGDTPPRSGFGQVKILLEAYVQLYVEQQAVFALSQCELDAVILAERPDPETV